MICFRRRNCTVQDILFKRRFLNIYYDKKKRIYKSCYESKKLTFSMLYIYFLQRIL